VTSRAIIEAALKRKLDPQLVDELLEAYGEAKGNFLSGGHRLQAVEGGRFCEAAFRLLQIRVWGKSDPLGASLDTERLIKSLAALPSSQETDSVRLHIPRALRVVYDIRNKRDVAHLADGIDPNLQDATLVVSVVDWVMAEFVRLYHAVPPNEAREIVEDLVTRRAPVVQDFDGFLKALNPKLRAGDLALVLLYQKGAQGAKYEELERWAAPSMRRNLRRTLDTLVVNKAFAHFDGDRYRITLTGQAEVERRRLLTPP